MDVIKATGERPEMYSAHKYIAKNLRLLRNLKGVSQEHIANMVHMSRSCYSCLESGHKLPDFLTVHTLSRFYDVSLDCLLHFDLSEQILSLLKAKHSTIEPTCFMEKYLELSHGAKFQICVRMENLLQNEGNFNCLPRNSETNDKIMAADLKTLANNLKLLRITNHISQEELASRIHIARSTYSTYETGTKVPDLQTIDALSTLYDIGFDSLVNYDLSDGLMSKIYFENTENHLGEIMNAYLHLSIVSKKLLMERIEVLLDRESIFYKEYAAPLCEEEHK